MTTLKHAKLTPKEAEAVAALRAAVEALPKTLLLYIDTFDADSLRVMKSPQAHVHSEVARIACRVLN